jgi:hypothetical protein
MTNGLDEIIQKLEQQRTAIDRALDALREVEGPASGNAASSSPAAAKATRKGGMTPEGRRRLSEALKARWAAKRAGSPAAPATKKAVRKGGMTPEGRKRLSEALRKRWAAKRAASATKKGGRKQA